MSRAMRTTAVRRVVLGLALAGVGLAGSTIAQAADFEPQIYGGVAVPGPAPVPYPAPNYGAVYEQAGPCHLVLDRRIDPWGREIVRRLRVCDEGPVYPAFGGPVPLPGYGYPGPGYFAPQPSGYYAYPPRPPLPIGPVYPAPVGVGY
jgi:hypothetical protein